MLPLELLLGLVHEPAFLLALIVIGLHAVPSYNDWTLTLVGDAQSPECMRRELEAAQREIEALERIVHAPEPARHDADPRRLSEEGECM